MTGIVIPSAAPAHASQEMLLMSVSLNRHFKTLVVEFAVQRIEASGCLEAQ